MKLCNILLAIGGTAALLAGCGGGGYYDGCAGSDYPQSRYVTFYLRVEDPWGNPVGGATVEIDGFRVDGPTTDYWVYVGYEGPPEWWGWAYNWGVENYRVVIYEPDEVRYLRVRVSAPDLGSEDAWVEIGDCDPLRVYVRIVFVLGAGPYQAEGASATQPQPEYFRSAPSDAPLPRRP